MNNDLLLELLEAIIARPNKHAPIFDDGRPLNSNTVKHLEQLISQEMVEGSVKSAGVEGTSYRTRINGVTPKGLEYLKQLQEM